MSSRIFWALLLIAVGAWLLLQNLGFDFDIPWDVVWPVAIILLGVSVLLERGRKTSSETVDDAVSLDGASSARVKIRHGAGRLVISSVAGPGLLAQGRFGGGLERSVKRSGDSLDVTLQSPGDEWIRRLFPWNWGDRERFEWVLGLTGAVPLALELETGVSESRLDLSLLQVTELTVKTGASSTEVILPALAPFTRARVESGAASVDIVAPAGVAGRISGTVPVGTFDVDQARFPRRDGAYESPGFAEAAHRFELKVQGGVGTVRVR